VDLPMSHQTKVGLTDVLADVLYLITAEKSSSRDSAKPC